MSDIVDMSHKIRLLVGEVTKLLEPGERVTFEMMATYIYTEGFKDGYAKGYIEANTEQVYERKGE